LLVGSSVYLLDRFHGNLKIVDLKADSAECCIVIKDIDAKWLTDLAYFQGKFVISTDLSTLVVLDSLLEHTSQISVPNGEKYFVGSSKDSLIVYNVSRQERYFLDESLDKLESTASFLDVFEKSSFKVDYWYEIAGSTATIRFRDGLEVPLQTGNPETLKIAPEAVNLDYNGYYLVYYEIASNEKALVLHVYEILDKQTN